MSVIEQTPYGQLAGNGVTTLFPFNFLALIKTDLSVYLDGVLKAVDVDYVVAGLGVLTGGSVTFSVAPGNGVRVDIIRTMARTRSTDYQNLGDFNADTVDADFDRAILLIQDQNAQAGRSIRTPANEVATLPTLPSIANRSGKYVAFDATGQPIVSVGTGNDTALRTDLANTLVGSIGALLVGYRHTLAGAIARTIAAKLRERVSIQDFGAIADAAIDGSSGTDSTAAIQAALNSSATEIYAPPGNYLFSNLTIPAEKVLIGAGIHQTNFVCAPGSVGTMFTDQGSAAKVSVRGIAFYGNNRAYTAGFRLGYGATPFGTEAKIDELWVRDLPAGFPGIDISGNVGHFGRILAQDTGGLQIVGVANMVEQAQSYGAKGFTVAAIQVATNLQLTHIDALEIEATAAGVVPLYLTENSSIDALTIAPTANTVYPHLIEIAAGCTTWWIGQLQYVFAAGTTPTITNGNIKSGALYFGGNVTGKSHAGEGNYGSGFLAAGTQFGVKQQQLNAFKIRLVNTAGTIQHRIGHSGDSSVAGNFETGINGASTALTNTPTGADGATAFAAGVKIGSASTSVIYFDTPDQVAADGAYLCAVSFNNAGVAYSVLPFVVSININGVVRTRLGIQLTNATTGASVAWSAALGTPGFIIDVSFLGFLRSFLS